MYAIIRTGGNQYRVRENDEIEVEKLDIPEGQSFEVQEVLAVGEGEDINVGFPYLKNAKVEAELLEQGLGDEVIVFKYKPKKKYRKKNIHRQPFSKIRITNIEMLSDDVDELSETITDDSNSSTDVEVTPEEALEQTNVISEEAAPEEASEQIVSEEAAPEEVSEQTDISEETAPDDTDSETEVVETETVDTDTDTKEEE